MSNWGPPTPDEPKLLSLRRRSRQLGVAGLLVVSIFTTACTDESATVESEESATAQTLSADKTAPGTTVPEVLVVTLPPTDTAAPAAAGGSDEGVA